MISIIAACDNNYLIGLNGKLPWHIPADLKRFKELTTGHAVIMGRKTWEGLPIKPLPNRHNIIISNTATYSTIPNVDVDVAGNLSDAVHHFAENKYGCKDIFIIGGASLYAEAMPIADRIYMTRVDTIVQVKPEDEGVYFPHRLFDVKDWELASAHAFSPYTLASRIVEFQIYDRRKSNAKV